MNGIKNTMSGMVFSILVMVASHAHAEVVNYSLENVYMADNFQQISGEFTWTYEVGDFENGVGQFNYLEIPYTAHDQTDLIINIDIGSSIEITLEGNFHDDGVDITLVLLQPLTPTSGSDINLAQSHYDIGGNGFHAGLFYSGSITPSTFSAVGEQPDYALATTTLSAYPNPFNPRTQLEFELEREATVRLEIFDMRGRSIRLLTDNVYTIGMHSVSWDGTDGLGQSVPSGYYFARLKTGGEILSRPMMLVR